MPKKPTEFELSLKGFTVEEREAIAVEVIDRIKERTQDGKDKFGRQFKSYKTKDYAKFKSSVGASSKVDLTLSGDMLDSIEIIANKAGKVVIGYSDGNPERGKAEGNILGTYGQQKQTAPKRDFLGLTKRELDQILSKYEKDEKRAEKILKQVEDAEFLSGAVEIEEPENGE